LWFLFPSWSLILLNLPPLYPSFLSLPPNPSISNVYLHPCLSVRFQDSMLNYESALIFFYHFFLLHSLFLSNVQYHILSLQVTDLSHGWILGRGTYQWYLLWSFHNNLIIFLSFHFLLWLL
jgi:hypothetical protein